MYSNQVDKTRLVTSGGVGFMFSKTFLRHSFHICHPVIAQMAHRVSRVVIFGPPSFRSSVDHFYVVSVVDRPTLTPRVPNHTRLAHLHWNNTCSHVSILLHIGQVGEVSIPRRTRFAFTAIEFSSSLHIKLFTFGGILFFHKSFHNVIWF